MIYPNPIFEDTWYLESKTKYFKHFGYLRFDTEENTKDFSLPYLHHQNQNISW